jgi:PAS domain S-box-containing protein
MVDDRLENLVALEAVLQPLGHRLVRATSGREALRHLLRMDFAVILMDVQMPEMNGFETVSLIKGRPRSRDIPIIFLTAISKEEHYVTSGYSAGAVDYIFKPFQPEILRSKVNVFVDLYLKQREIERQGELLRASQRRELELRHRAQMLAAGARYAQIVDTAMDPIISVGSDDRIKGFNAAAQRTFRVAAAEAIGKPIDQFLRGGLQAAHPPLIEDPAGVQEGTCLRADGTEFEVEYTRSTLEIAEGVEHTLILRDVSERRRTAELLKARTVSLADTLEELKAVNEQLSQRTRDLESAIGIRSRFYASMSHELRTPINAILGYSSLLLDGVFGNLEGDQRGSVERTLKAANHLMELVNDILDLSKVEAGKMELSLEPVVFPDLVLDLLATVEPLAEQYGVELQLNSCEVTILSDPRRIRQVILNLLSNAIKFGNGKPVEVSCRPEDDGFFVVEVQDHGPGIAESDQERIFEEFVQLESQQKPGTGLGLPISRRLAELLGGTLSVESEVGKGSTFRLRIPISANSPHDVSAHELAGRMQT